MPATTVNTQNQLLYSRKISCLKRKARGYLFNRRLGLFNGLLSNIIGVNLGFGLSRSVGGSFLPLVTAYFIYGFVVWHGLYFLNDLFDADEDARHPDKSARPLVLGQLTKREAWSIVLAHISVALVLSWQISPALLILSTFTIIQQVLYSVPPVRLRRFLFLGPMLAGSVGWILRFLVGWTLVKPIFDAPPVFCTFVALFAYSAYLARTLEHRASIGAWVSNPIDCVAKAVGLATSASAVALFVVMSLVGPLNRSALMWLLVFGASALGLAWELRRGMSFAGFESGIKIALTVTSFGFMLSLT